MQNNLRIDYRLSFLPFLVLLLLALASLFAIALLHYPLTIYVLLVAALAVLLAWSWLQFLQKPQSLHFDGRQWCVSDAGETVCVDVLPTSFSSRFFIVLVLCSCDRKKRYTLCFSRANCGEGDFRALCRLLRYR